MFIGEAPGVEEDRTGRPFQGKAGGVLNPQLNGWSLPLRDDVYITNIVKERPENNRDPRPDEIARDEPELWGEIAEVRPEIIVTLGRVSTRYFLGDVDTEMVHGIPFPADNINLCAIYDAGDMPVIFPTYHPAAGLHAPELMALFHYDMQRLALFLKGQLPPRPEDKWAGREKYEIGYPGALCDVVAIDTEGLPGRPWGLSISDMAGEGYVLKAGMQEEIRMLREDLRG